MELNWLDWYSFLEMLSVERTAPFLSELALPFDQKRFPQVMRLSRACLEVHVFSTVSVAKDNPDFPGLTEAWQRYREVEGVLSDESIQKFHTQYERPEIDAQAVYSDLREWIGSNTADNLKNWFVRDFRSGPDPIWQWHWALKLLLTHTPHKVVPTTPAPITEDEQRRVESFCTRCGAALFDLEMRFYITRQVAKSTLPTIWEKVLQTFPAGGLGNKYPWLSSIEQCLQLRLIRKEWARLDSELGHSAMSQLTTWVREQEKALPHNASLPREPELFNQERFIR